MQTTVSTWKAKINARAIAAATLIASGGFNVSLAVLSAWNHQYAAAGAQSVIVAILATWLAARPKLDAWLDTRLAEAIAQRAAADVVLEELQRLQREGQLRIGVKMGVASVGSSRVN